MMKLLDKLFRVALLVILVAGLALATWHISWLHSQPEARYEMQLSTPFVVVFDRQERVIYSGSAGFNDGKPIDWRTSPLPNKP